MKRLNTLVFLLTTLLIAAIVGIILQGLLPGRALIWSSSSFAGATGMDGGAIACGLLGTISLFGIIWIEITRFKNSNPK